MISLGAMAQQVIRGTVRDSVTQAPIPGATIKVINGTGGVVTNAKGEFELRVPANAKLQISSIGFESVVMPAQLIVKPVMLKVSVLSLSSTVVVGYGSQQKRTVTNSVSSVSSRELAAENNIVSDIGKALQGRVAGVMVANSSGTPGGTPNILIRGVQSARANDANPLLVIDGLVIDGGTISLNSINPQDVESVEVLKDAASAAIYGARGSTGVIIITTKKGKQNSKPVFSVNAYTGFNNVPTSRRMLTSSEYKEVFNDARNNRITDIENQLANPGNLTPVQISQLKNEIIRLKGQVDGLKMADRSIDWIDRIKNKRAPVNNIQASMSGGGEKNNYYMSLGRYQEDATMGTGRFERYTGKVDITQQVNNWLKLSGNLNISQSAGKNNSYPLVSAFNVRPDTPEELIYLPDGSLGYYAGRQQNPLGEMKENKNKRKTLTYFGSLSADLQLHRTLQFRSAFSLNKYNTNNSDFQSAYGYLGAFNKGYLKTSGSDNLTYNWDNYFTYTNRWKKLGINATAGYAFYSTEYSAFGYDLNGFPKVEGITGGGAAGTYGSVASIGSLNSNTIEKSEAYFGRLGLDWDGKYMLNASIRTDGSSKLAKGYRYSWFPSVSVGWDIARENFMQSAGWVQLLKVRTSYGLSGNIRPLATYGAFDLLQATTYLGDPALKLRDIISNPQVRWEETKQVDAGLDVAMFANRLNLTIDYYNKTTRGLLSSRFIPWEFGAQSIPFNVGDIRNKGIDIELGYGSRSNARLRWKVETNLNFNRNKVVSLSDSVLNFGTFIFGGPGSKVKVGQPVGSVEVYQSLGVDPQTGDLVYQDGNKDGVINTKDYVTVPIALPKFTGGFNFNIGYANFTLEALFTFNVGGKVYDYYEQTLRNYDVDFNGVMPNKFDIVNRRWRKPGDVTDIPRAIVGVHGAGRTTDWNYRPSTQYIYDASYFRLRNLMVAYDVPATLMKKAGLTRARVYASAQNVFTTSKYIGFDPEAAANSGIVSTNLPNPRAMVLGIDLSF